MARNRKTDPRALKSIYVLDDWQAAAGAKELGRDGRRHEPGVALGDRDGQVHRARAEAHRSRHREDL